MISPVQFMKAMEDLCALDKSSEPEDAINSIVEIGPHSSLETPIKEIWKTNTNSNRKFLYLPTLRRGKNGVSTCLDLAAALLTMGHPMRLSAINFPSPIPKPKLLGDLPSYPWMHEKSYWHESRLSRDYRFGLSHLMIFLETSIQAQPVLSRNGEIFSELLNCHGSTITKSNQLQYFLSRLILRWPYRQRFRKPRRRT